MKFASLVLFSFLLPAVAVGATDPRAGSWTLVSAQSSLTPANTLSVTMQQGVVHVVIAGETHVDFTAKPNGHAGAVAGNPGFDQVALRRVDKRSTEVTESKNGGVVATVTAKVSKDGRELTATTVSAGHAPQIAVWTRSGGKKEVGDPLAGEWTEDMGLTRLRQGLAIKVEADAGGGVRFAGDGSYSARLDGKSYDVRNSRNDTVALMLVDPHTVDAVYRRDGQVSQRERWVVSGDGQQMTVTTTATLETGQRLSETLVFKRQ